MTPLDTAAPGSRRPFAIILLCLFFLILSLAGWVRLILTIQNWGLLQELNAQPGPAYIALGGLLWGLMGLPAAISLWTRQRWAPLAAAFLALAYTFTYWLDRFLVAIIGNPPANNLFALGATLAGLGYLLWALTRKGSRRYFSGRTGNKATGQ